MQPALVIGSTRATVKHDSLDGQRLLIVQPLGVNDTVDGPPLVVIDAQGSRKGDTVMLTSDGTYARDLTGHNETPARWSVMGIIDNQAKP